MKLGEILVRSGKVSAADVERVAAAQPANGASRSRLGDMLTREGLISGRDLREALAEQFSIPAVDAVSDAWLDPTLLQDVPVEWARSNGLLPVRRDGEIAVLIEDPTRVELLDDLALLLKSEAGPVIAPAEEIRKAIERCYVRRDETASTIIEKYADFASDATVGAEEGQGDLLRSAEDAPVTQLVNVILLDAVKARASDIHVEPVPRELRVRFRVDGRLYDQASPPKAMEAGLVSRLKVMGGLDIAEKRLPQDGMARVRVGEQEIDIRISTIPVSEGERVVLRLLNRASTLIPFEELGMPKDVLHDVQGVLRHPHGVILVTGPTGSGKTTTLYAALNALDTAHRNVLTIEDPVEYRLPNVGQMQVKPKIGLTFAHGLRHILRQDPDVVLVGEVRDMETAEIMIRASLTGHLAFSTLHTNDAAGAILRLADMGVPRYMIAAALRAVLAQRLVRKVCPHCSVEANCEPGEVAEWGEAAAGLAGRPVRQAKACSRCLSGYADRTGIYELLRVSDAIREAIRGDAQQSVIEALAREAGARTLLDDAVAKVAGGVTTVDEIRQVLGGGAARG